MVKLAVVGRVRTPTRTTAIIDFAPSAGLDVLTVLSQLYKILFKNV